MIIIVDLAKQCECNHCTIRKWIKQNDIKVHKVKAISNGKWTQAISTEDANKFSSHWEQSTCWPDDMISIPDLSREVNMDRATIRNWAAKNGVKVSKFRKSDGPPAQAISKKDAKRFKQEYHETNCILVTDILRSYNTDWRVVRRWMERNNCEFTKIKSNKGGRSQVALKKNDAIDLEKYLMQMKSEGFFYMIQPIPELNPNRIKLGFSRNVKKRLKHHQRCCPNAKIIKTWKCHKDDEAKIRNQVTDGCTQLFTEIDNRKTATEVFDCEDYQIILERLERMF